MKKRNRVNKLFHSNDKQQSNAHNVLKKAKHDPEILRLVKNCHVKYNGKHTRKLPNT